MFSKEERIANEIDRIITCLKDSTNQQERSKIHEFASSIISNGAHRAQHISPEKLKETIFARVAGLSGQRTALKSQDATRHFLDNGAIYQKQQVLQMLLKLSELSQKDEADLPTMFGNRRSTGMNTLEVNFRKESEQHSQNISLERNRGVIGSDITESELVRQLTIVFTNTSTSLIQETKEGYQLKSCLNVREPVRNMVNEIAELGWLHRHIMNYDIKEGIIGKALREAIRQELKQFQIWNKQNLKEIENNRLSLRKLYVFCFYPEEILRWIAIILQNVEAFGGCTIISIINSYRPSGVKSINDLISRLLSHVTRPLLAYIQKWIYTGQLFDPKKEFFIDENKQVSKSDEWNERFTLNTDNIPNVLDCESSKMILNIGKSIYFLNNEFKIYYKIRTSFIEEQLFERINSQGENSFNSSIFKDWLSQIYKQVNKVLMDTLLHKFYLKHHLECLKNVFMCGKGDFIQHLYDTLHEKLASFDQSVSEHMFHGFISDAINRCFVDYKLPNSQNYYKQHIIYRLQMKRIKFSGADDGQDCLNFQYSLYGIEFLQTFFSSKRMKNYQRVFDFLWRLKKLKQILKNIWFSSSSQNSCKLKKARNADFNKIYHYVYLLRATMSHFIDSFESYLMTAIEQRWNNFSKEVDETKSLDELLKRHGQFQIQILQIVFSLPKGKNILALLQNAFKIIRNFKLIFTNLQEQFANYYEKSIRQQTQSQQLVDIQQRLQKSRKDVLEVKKSFDDALKSLFEQLRRQIEFKDRNLKALMAKLDFNSFYTTFNIDL